MVRLEDVSALVSPATITQLSDYLYALNTPMIPSLKRWTA